MKSVDILIRDSKIVYEEVEVNGHKGFILKPGNQQILPGCPWIWYAPTIMGSYPSSEENFWMFRQLLDAGLPICGVDVGESYGNSDGRKIYTEFYKKIVADYVFSPRPRLLPQSRGGLMLYLWAAENPDCVECIAGIFPVCDINSYPLSHPWGLPEVCDAYGMTESELRAYIQYHNPVDRMEPLAQRKIPVLHVHGDQDRSVPLENNSDALARRYCDLGGTMKVIVIKGKGHEVCPEFFQSQPLVDFLLSGGHFTI